MPAIQISRRFALALAPLAALAAIAFASEPEVVWFNAPPSVVAGQSFSAGVTLNQAPTSVTFTSSPPGLVNYTAVLASTSQTVNVPTNGAASAGVYTITATPTAGGTSKSVTVLLESGPNKPGGGG